MVQVMVARAMAPTEDRLQPLVPAARKGDLQAVRDLLEPTSSNGAPAVAVSTRSRCALAQVPTFGLRQDEGHAHFRASWTPGTNARS